METTLKHFFRIGLVWIAVIGITACTLTSTPFEYHDDREEKHGPGLFSGEDGGFVITTEQESKIADTEKPPTADQ
jgi:hypothetical protein